MANETPLTICAECRWYYYSGESNAQCLHAAVAKTDIIWGKYHPECSETNKYGNCKYYERKKGRWTSFLEFVGIKGPSLKDPFVKEGNSHEKN